jgi:pimeloyl-ACP methyl ester carboxylesterase
VESLILVHGLWFNGMDMSLLGRRLRRAGYDVHRFSYRSVRNTPRENAVLLEAFAAALDAPVIHFVAHSLGGIVVRHLFHNYPDQRPGRVVTLGTPHRPSSAASNLLRWSTGPIMLGESIREGLLGGAPPWPADRELGSIAGDLRLGLGLIVPGIAQPSDGTVAVDETILPGMTDHVTLPVSHFGMLLSRRVFRETEQFLRHGRFAGGAMRPARAVD